MDELKRKMVAEKEKLMTIQAPESLEFTLKKALAKQASRRRLTLPKWTVIAASIFLLLLIGFQHQALSYFGKKIFGYDALTSETISQLMKNEFGQPVEASLVFEDGNTLVVDAVLSDENQFIVYLRLKNTGEISHFKEQFADDLFRLDGLSAFLTKYDGHSSVSMLDETTNEIKMVATFNKVSPFAKKINLLGSYDGAPFTITFPYEASRALATGLKKKLKTKVVLDSDTLKFQQLIATPTSTLIKGTFTNNQVYFDNIDLLVNGRKLEQQGSSAKTDLFGKKFMIHYEPFPEKVETIALVINEYPTTKVVEEEFPLQAKETLSGLEKEVFIDAVEIKDGNLAVTITTEVGVRLKNVFVHHDGKKLELDQTIDYTEKETTDGIRVTRTLIFNTDVIPSTIEIGSYEYYAAEHFSKEWKIK